MNRAVLYALGGVSLAFGAFPAAAQDVNFKIGSVELTMPLPAGYCLPQGTAIEAAKLMEKSDTKNVTLATFYNCKTNYATATDYILVKATRDIVNLEITKAEVLSQLSVLFKDKAFVDSINGAGAEAGADISAATGTRVSARLALQPAGVDPDCGYLTGKVTLVTEEKEATLSVAMCMSAAGGRMFGVYRYADDPWVPAALRPLTRTIANSVKPRATP